MARRAACLSWDQLAGAAASCGGGALDRVNGPANAQARLRLFGRGEGEVRVTLYRDHHAWCPYCQKVWLWLEEKRVPYRVEKVTMFCYGEKERWYTKKCPSGMLPALELDGRLITESDVVLSELERAFGPLSKGMADPAVVPMRRLERTLFRSWCQWLCYPASSAQEEAANQRDFERVAGMVESALAKTPGPYLLPDFSTADVVFTPYIERIDASLYYYKGWSLRDPAVRPRIAAWFAAMESRETYLGTQSDYHTHAHDLPPQMGGCYENRTEAQQKMKAYVDGGLALDLPDTGLPEPAGARGEALARAVRHRDCILRASPVPAAADEAVRCALTYLATGDAPVPPEGGDVALRYLRDRISVPRDMSVWAARRLREACELTAARRGPGQGPPIPFEHRRDQDPRAFARPAASHA